MVLYLILDGMVTWSPPHSEWNFEMVEWRVCQIPGGRFAKWHQSNVRSTRVIDLQFLSIRRIA